MIENEVQLKIQQKLENLLNESGFIKSIQIKPEQKVGNFSVDLVADVQINGDNDKLVVEVKSLGEPKQVRASIQQLKQYIKLIESIGIAGDIIRYEENQIYGIVAAPYITEDSANICKENNIGFIDLAGNSYLKFGKVFIERKNFPNPYKEKRIVKSIFTPKASRILRVMLLNPKKNWQLGELAKESDISIGQAYKVKERMLSLEYVNEENKSIVLKKPESLLSKWAEYYNFKKNKMTDYFSFGTPKEIENKIVEYCNKNNIKYAMTLFSGAALVSPYARYNRVFVYIKENKDDMITVLGLKPVESGPNVTILEPFDDGIFYGIQNINGIGVVSNIQLYLDMVGYKGRGEETANFLLEQKIKTLW
ncbi:MAG: hypothetical protein A2551_08235 [Elusimicrobia bacterium RIFOXYD2_FULL_34_30]|nr:MAG: hypothetical protein A2551_08235 [Elusimicrobia bacterium RIFOXYD2_FULL_34_30]